MLKHPDPVKVESEARRMFEGVLKEIPFIEVKRAEPRRAGQRADLVLRVSAHGRPHTFVCEAKAHSQPRHVREAIAQLRSYIDKAQADVSAVVIAPYLSPASQQICRSEGVGFLDFEGNCHLVFDGVFIDRMVPTKPSTERHEFRSIFAPKSAQILRALLRDPMRRWRSTELAATSHVSLGHASNVRAALIDREWAKVDEDGLYLSQPNALLDVWRDVYEPPAGKRLAFYTTLHGKELQEMMRKALQTTRGHAMLASFSAAQWHAPYARVSTLHLYADHRSTQALQERLDLASSARGENVSILQPTNNGLFLDATEPVPGIRCTSAVQTYLDLWIAGDRGREAAEHLRAEKLLWPR